MSEDRMLLNLGSSAKIFPGWINVDHWDALGWAKENNRPSGEVQDYEKWFVHEDIMEMLPDIRDETVDAIAAIHVLDHFTLPDGVRILVQCRRILKPGGVLRIAVEDAALIIMAWLDEELDPYLQGQPEEVRTHYHPDLQFAVLLLGNLADRGHKAYTGHKMIYTEESLSSVLLDCGFDEVEVQWPGVSNIPEWKEWMDTQPEHSIIMEVRK